MQDITNTKSPLRLKTRLLQHDGANDNDDTHENTHEMPTSDREEPVSPLPEESNNEHNTSCDDMGEEMKREKQRYPGASDWAPAEERLFEILFLRQDLPILPTTWDVDLRGIPVSDTVFQTSDNYPPIIYAHLKNFAGKFTPAFAVAHHSPSAATQALTRLMDLTSKIRATCQSGHRKRASQHIKRDLDRYLNWAAQDGGFMHLRVVPNIMVEAVDTTMPEDEISKHIQNQMRSLAKLQREFLRADRSSRFWDVVKPNIFKTPRDKEEPKIKIEIDDESPSCARWLTPTESRDSPHYHIDRVFAVTESHDVAIKVEPGLKSPGLSATTQVFKTTSISKASSPPYSLPSNSPDEPQTPSNRIYTRHPPVVYGLFIINTSVLVLTTDSSKGPDPYVSFHIQVDFFDEHQGIWNALTIALVACLARDELRTRITDFEELPCVEDSDPDA